MYSLIYSKKLTLDSIRAHYDEYRVFMFNDTKLPFVKLVKEHTGLGLREAKDNTDIIFDGGITKFDNFFHIKHLRNMKLEKLKVRLFSKELFEIMKSKDEDDFVESLSKLDPSTLEMILSVLIEEEEDGEI